MYFDSLNGVDFRARNKNNSQYWGQGFVFSGLWDKLGLENIIIIVIDEQSIDDI